MLSVKYREKRWFVKVTVSIEGKEYIMKEEHYSNPGEGIINPAYVSVKAGVTLPIPNKKYASARIDVGLSVPTELDKIDETYEKVKDWVDERVL